MPDSLPEASEFAKKLCNIAKMQHTTFHQQNEHSPELAAQIKNYWITLGLPFPGVDTAWSAVFVSFCVKTAGATSGEFKFAAAHSVFVHEAIHNADQKTGFFQAFPIGEKSVGLGDIIQNNRGGNHFDFDFARNHANYISHSAVVVSRGEDGSGKFAITVGGNESDSIRETRVPLNQDGTVRQRAGGPFICIIKNLK